jgi:hypothetical protein
VADKSNHPRTILTAGVALFVFGAILIPVVWWLVEGVAAGSKTLDQIRGYKTQRDVTLYTIMLVGLLLLVGAVSVSAIGGGCVIIWKGLRRLMRSA